MPLTGLGFVFLLLPVLAALYYCIPNRFKAAALILISALVFYWASPFAAALCCASLLFDCVSASLLLRGGDAPSRPRRIFLRLCVGKDLLLALAGLLLPLLLEAPAPVGLISVSLSGAAALLSLSRGESGLRSPTELAAGVLFFGRLTLGPVTLPDALLQQIRQPRPSLSKIGQGIMRLVFGIAKQVILAEQLMALIKTLAHLPTSQFSVGSIWLAAFCSAFYFYLCLSSISDLAVGAGLIFSLELSHLTYFPFQAPSLRDYLYRMNLPLETALGRMLAGGRFVRERPDRTSYLASLLLPVVLALWISPTPSYLLWGLWMAALVLLDWLLLHRLPAPFLLFGRIVTFLLTLPSYLLLLPTPSGGVGALVLSMFGLGALPLTNDTLTYLTTSNLLLLILGCTVSLSLFNSMGRWVYRRLPALWWIVSSTFTLALLVASLSFLLWNVR